MLVEAGSEISDAQLRIVPDFAVPQSRRTDGHLDIDVGLCTGQMQGRVAAVTKQNKRLDEFSRFDSRDQVLGQLRRSSPIADRTRNIRQAIECVYVVGIYRERLLEALERRIEATQ